MKEKKNIRTGEFHKNYIDNGLVGYQGRWTKDKYYVRGGKFKPVKL